MRAVTLLIVFLIGKAAVLSERSIDWSLATLAAFAWQDVLVAALFGALEWTTRRRQAAARATLVVFWILVAYAALNIPVARVLSTPLTVPMLRGAGGALADSILRYATGTHALLIGVTLAAAAIMPRWLVFLPRTAWRIGAATAIAIVAIGPFASARIETNGLDRNVFVALAASALPGIDAYAAEEDWRLAIDAPAGDDWSQLRGIAAGRNVVLIGLESTAAQYLRLYGGTHDVTPNLDALARHGVVFDNAYAVYPESIKGLFSVLCSTYPAFDTTPEIYETASCQPLPALLARAGYRTALFHSGRFAYLGMESIIRSRGFETLEDAGHIGGNHESSFGVDEPSAVARILAWVDSLPKNQRFFVHYMPIAGHHPYDTPERGPFPTREEIDLYRNALHYGDRALGTLVEGLRARDLDGRTLFVILGDHGEAFGQHEGNYGHTFFLYEENVRVPFIVSAPGALEGAQRSRTVVSLVDTAPTVLDLLGMPIPDEHQGRSALDPEARMALFFTDYSLRLAGLRDGRWKFVYDMSAGRAKLFDLERDGGERIDVSRHQPERLAAYEQRVRSWAAAQKHSITGR